MPAYVSHTIMAREVYNKINNKNVNLEYMLTYSLGGDLCKYAKCRRDSHHIKQDEFIYNICDYMKENDLVNDSECLGFLYGHICHYVMDDTIHPLIRKVDKTCAKNKNNHTMIELYYDYYLSKIKNNVRLDKYDNRNILSAKTNKKISKLIDSVYLKTYECDNVSKYYKFNIWLYRKIKYLYKICSFNFLKNISGMKKFLFTNSDINLLNNDNKITYKDYLKKDSNSNLDTVYDDSVNRAIQYINKINDYLKEKR